MSIKISAIITAAGANTRMRIDQNNKCLPIKNKLLLPINNKEVIIHTITNTLKSNIDECIIVVGHYKNIIIPVISKINDDRIKIIENKNNNISLAESLLNGVNNSKGEICLCIAGDQPTITPTTFQNLINIILTYPEKNIISILSRIDYGFLKTAEGLGMPFACDKKLLKKYLINSSSNINPILRKMKSDNIIFYGQKEENPLELININRMADYYLILNNLK